MADQTEAASASQRTFSDPTRNAMRNMRTLRQARGWSGQELSRRLGEAGFPTERSVLANTEGGRKQSLTVGFLFALAHVFDVDPWILTGSEPICVTCGGMPPVGLSCLHCGRGARK